MSSYDEMHGVLECTDKSEMNTGFGRKTLKKEIVEDSAQKNIKNGPERW
jgi:hypothetical protein